MEIVDLVIDMKKVFELKGIINSWESCFSFWIDQYQSSKRTHNIETERTETNKGRNTFQKWDFRISHN